MLQVTLHQGRNHTIAITHKPTWPSHSPFHQSPSLLSMRILECFCESQRNRMNNLNGVMFVSLSGCRIVNVVTWTTNSAQKLHLQTLKRESHYAYRKIPVTSPQPAWLASKGREREKTALEAREREGR